MGISSVPRWKRYDTPHLDVIKDEAHTFTERSAACLLSEVLFQLQLHGFE
jgi:hypothetical protein